MQRPGSISITRAELTADVSRALIAALNAELGGIYPEPGASHFRLDPDEVAAGRGRALGIRRLVLETGVRQAAALGLYRATGFQPIPLFGEYRLSPDTSVCLGKELLDIRRPQDPGRRR